MPTPSHWVQKSVLLKAAVMVASIAVIVTAPSGNGSTEVAQAAPVDRPIDRVSVAAGGNFTCALTSAPEVICWGVNSVGQLGLGDSEYRGDDAGETGRALLPIDLGTDASPTKVVAGGNHACVLLEGGDVKCWGLNSSGQLGLEDGDSRGDHPDEMGDALPVVNLGTDVTVTDISAGERHTCALLDTGDVKCWGNSLSGQLGLGTTDRVGMNPGEMGDALPAVDLGTGATVAQISAGGYHSCALLNTGDVKCWGQNFAGELGLGDADNRGDVPGEMGNALPAIDLGTDVTVTQIAAGFFHTCALLDTGDVKCWGLNTDGQLGLGDTVYRGRSAGQMGDALPIVDFGGKTARFLSTSGLHTCALLSDDDVKCWGESTYGQVGIPGVNSWGDRESDMGAGHPAVPLSAYGTVQSISAGWQHTCVVVGEWGDVKCWGQNTYGKLGLGDTDNRGRNEYLAMSDLPNVDLGTDGSGADYSASQISLSRDTGSQHVCVLLNLGDVKCWGSNEYGQLGQDDTTERGSSSGQMHNDLARIQLGKSATSVSVGANHSCAVLNTGSVQCWGLNDVGQLGLGDTTDRGDDAGEMSALTTVTLGNNSDATSFVTTAVAVGWDHSCAVSDIGEVKCWGLNDVGQLGQGNTVTIGDDAGETAALVSVDLGQDSGSPFVAAAVTAGQQHTCALSTLGTVKCWGYVLDNALGHTYDGLELSMGDEPSEMGVALLPVNLAGPAAAIAAGSSHTCALLTDGSVQCWGGWNDWGELGESPDKMGSDVVSEVDLGAGRTASAVVSGASHSCALLSGSGGVKCWGRNSAGQLGLDDVEHRGDDSGEMGDSLPFVELPDRAIAMGAGSQNTCVALVSGTVKCWGANDNGQLGIGNRATYGAGRTEYNLRDVLPTTLRLVVNAPGAPTGVGVVGGDGELVVSWLAPVDDGGASVTGYVASTSTGATCSTTGLSCTISGLTNGTSYSVTVVATNAAGSGDVSASVVGTPVAPPVDGSSGVGGFVPIDGVRVVDTRGGVKQGGVKAFGVPLRVDVGALDAVPVDAVAVAVNITVTGAEGWGYVAAYPCATTDRSEWPGNSNVNFNAGSTVANSAIVPLNNGHMCLLTYGTAHLIVDVSGYMD